MSRFWTRLTSVCLLLTTAALAKLPTVFAQNNPLVGSWYEFDDAKSNLIFYPDGRVIIGLITEGHAYGTYTFQLSEDVFTYNDQGSPIVLDLTICNPSRCYAQQSTGTFRFDGEFLQLDDIQPGLDVGQNFVMVTNAVTSIPPADCPGALPPHMIIGNTGWIPPGGTTHEGTLRNLPQGDAVKTVHENDLFYVLAGPVCTVARNGHLNWWQVQLQDGHGTIGWMAEGYVGGDYWIEPFFVAQGGEGDQVTSTPSPISTSTPSSTITPQPTSTPVTEDLIDLPMGYDESTCDLNWFERLYQACAFEPTNRHQCTALVDEQRRDLDDWHNRGSAYLFDDSACASDPKHGITVSIGDVQYAQINDIVVWNQECGGDYQAYGHVAIVRGVDTASNTIYVWERNYDSHGSERGGPDDPDHPNGYPHKVLQCMSFIHEPNTGEDNSYCESLYPPPTSTPVPPPTTSGNVLIDFFNWLLSLLGIK